MRLSTVPDSSRVLNTAPRRPLHTPNNPRSGNAVNHQPEFAAATVTPSGEQAIRDGALAMAYTIIDMAEQNVWDQL